MTIQQEEKPKHSKRDRRNAIPLPKSSSVYDCRADEAMLVLVALGEKVGSYHRIQS